MTKRTKTTVLKESFLDRETPMDRTSRVVRKMIDDEAEQRQLKLDRLRNARLEREANTPTKAVAGAKKKPSPKVGVKR
ncbi:hypothetical protein L0666_14395 [Octadecabacter sp. CECT 8868]|uniref:hypothetical protein n=1 Tax=Octadecabacter algicola TaxID=2909342 RepID=UPI001F47C77A|nr:hypothetical protein [Octadecabacter algicola]MCF2906182.1 hypothetical protein [Octadecabacter algicola]